MSEHIEGKALFVKRERHIFILLVLLLTEEFAVDLDSGLLWGKPTVIL